jgi:Mg/Co/Ni transporter MgtE
MGLNGLPGGSPTNKDVDLEKGDKFLEAEKDLLHYKRESVLESVKSRGGWLLVFFLGLMMAAVVIEAFEDVLRSEVELSYFVPLLIGHGGNTGSQSVATVIRALALGHVTPADLPYVLRKEAITGCGIGGILGLIIFLVSLLWKGISTPVGMTVAVALPLVSLWANLLGGLFPLMAVRLGYNPAVTSAPLMTTVVDSSGLIIYFYIAKWLLGI